MTDVIRSASNASLKRARAAAAGREPGRVLLEGRRLVEDALAAGWEVEECLVAEDAEPPSGLGDPGRARRVAAPLLARASTLAAAPDLLAVAREPEPVPLERLPAQAAAFLVVAAGVQDPGNLGAIARVAEAAGATALAVAGEGARPFGGKALRGSMGSLLRLPVVVAPGAAEFAADLERAGWRSALARARAGASHTEFDWTGPLALWLAAESGDLPPDVAARAEAFEGVTIPMAPGVESLNVATAAAILCFAAGRVAPAKGGGDGR